MSIIKEITKENELCLWMNGKLIYKRWLNNGYSKVFDTMSYGKDTFLSIVEDDEGNIKQRISIFINGNTCETKNDFWDMYASQIPQDSAIYFGKNLDAFNDAITAGGPGFPGDCLIEIIGTKKLKRLFGIQFDFIIKLLNEADFVELIIEKEE